MVDEKITQERKSYRVEGGILTLAPPASGEFKDGSKWSHDYKIELVYGKTVVPIKTKGMYDTLLDALQRPGVKRFADQLPVTADISELGELDQPES